MTRTRSGEYPPADRDIDDLHTPAKLCRSGPARGKEVPGEKPHQDRAGENHNNII
ncbi:hypothetical protein GCM10009861_08440 [Neomicrococcus aestuarii]